jgi:Mu-like prophage major head subunit gpT
MSTEIATYKAGDIHKPYLNSLRESIDREFGLDADYTVGGVGRITERGKVYSWGKLREDLRDKLTEVSAETAFAAVLRYGVTKALLNNYEVAPVTFRDVALAIPSTGFENYYAPTYNPGLPVKVDRGEKYPEVKLALLTNTIRNNKWGAILNIEQELIDDDQTGQLGTRAAQVGNNMAQAQELDVYTALFNGNPNISYTSVGMQAASGGGLTIPNLTIADGIAGEITDPDGNIIIVDLNTLVVDYKDRLTARQLLNSLLIPSNPGSSPAVGSVVYFGTINPLKDAYQLKECRLLVSASKASTGTGNGNALGGIDNTNRPWWLMQAKASLVFQDREALSVMVEAPNSGSHFDSDAIRHKAKARWGSGVIDPRFEYRGN